MPTFNIPDQTVNQTLEALIAYEAQQIPWLGAAILGAIFLIIWLAGSFVTERKSGKSQMITWGMIASFVTSTVGLILFLYPGIISLEVIVIFVAITLGFGLLYFVSNID